MFCQQCGANIPSESKFCSQCGIKVEDASTTNVVNESGKGSPLWFKFFFGLIALIGAIALFIVLSSEDLTDTVENQLKALRQNHITEAYYQYTAKAFQEATSLELFHEFINKYPLFSKTQSVRFIDRNVNNNHGILDAILTQEKGTDVTVQYQLVKEDGRWKVLSIKLGNQPNTPK